MTPLRRGEENPAGRDFPGWGCKVKRARIFCILTAGCALALAGTAAGAGEPAHRSGLPDTRLTPGAVAETRTAVICVRGYLQAHRVWHDKIGTLAKYGISPDQADLFEDDDLIPVCLGGENASPLNHWAQPYDATPGAADKDVLERRLCTRACLTRDDAQLARYQAAFAKDWVALWQQEQGSPR
jgi:hypothetical protein